MSRGSNPPSKLLMDECFQAGDDRFLDIFVRFEKYELLRAFVGVWLKDERPWARQQIIEYLKRPLNFPGHEVVVKRLFKHFESHNDLEMLPHFLVCFDRLVRRSRSTRYCYDWNSRRSWSEEFLRARPNQTVKHEYGRTAQYTYGGRTHTYPLPDLLNRPGNRLFSHLTRNHLRRRIWRYYRQLGHRDLDAYAHSVSLALAVFEDSDFAAGENILDNWSMMHACYFHHHAIQFGAAHANVVEGRSLGELAAKPYLPQAWQTETGAERLLWLVQNANSSLIRLWAMELIRTDNVEAIGKIDVGQLIDLLSHADPRVQEFAAELFHHHPGLAALRVERWLQLLDRAGGSVLTMICEAMRRHVSPDRLDAEQTIELACAKPAPVSRMGVELLRSRHAKQPFTAAQVERLANAKCQATCRELTTWALSELNQNGVYSARRVVAFFDSLEAPMRFAAMDWLTDPASSAHADPILWSWLIESPFDDVKLRLVEALAAREHLPGASPEDITPVWIAVILGVHRGGRTKLKAVRQIADTVATDESRRDQLLPVLAVALRSIRRPERRAALAALARLVVHRPDLKPLIAEHAPELQWVEPALEEPA